MPFITEAERTVDVPRERAFDRLADLASWPRWMPRSFRPVAPRGGSLDDVRALRSGDRMRVRIAGGPPSSLRVTVADRPRELTWRGGVRGLIWAEHRFLFEPDGEERTRIRSVETWRGPLARLAKRVIAPLATRIGGEQLDALVGALAEES